ncbi:endonuclease domain-containing protein [Salegentibacter sp. JZCK2]|uniref:endonuclease domain-containing protein n=1 Tax=Salegentibacter tibetensis TaxID=2873600 RepID=UPI001CCA7662|nr:endonuclease domain-containing protein [Salegentibacter tibetensis]MBZ9728702.1 endonuclease domain-containing protein [Salegentibacter tibetensis]
MKKDHPGYNKSMWKGAPLENFAIARKLRQNMTSSEKMLWEHLNNNQLGYKFRRQHPLQSFIVDFYCHQFKLVIEIDGGYHNSKKQKVADQEREELLQFQELHILRFTNEEVVENIQKVIEQILKKMDELKVS